MRPKGFGIIQYPNQFQSFYKKGYFKSRDRTFKIKKDFTEHLDKKFGTYEVLDGGYLNYTYPDYADIDGYGKMMYFSNAFGYKIISEGNFKHGEIYNGL